MAKQKQNVTLVAEICLYGNGPAGCGAGWITAEPGGRMLGEGDPIAGLSFTEAVWMAVDALRAVGVLEGVVAIYAPGGERYALAPIGRVPYYGSLAWQSPAPGYTITADEVINAAQAS